MKQPIDEDKENMVSTTDSKDESSKYVLILQIALKGRWTFFVIEV